MRIKLSTVFLSLSLLVAPAAMAASATARLYQRSFKLEAAGKHEKALEALRSVEQGSRDYFFYMRVGWLGYRAKKHAQAIAAYRHAAALKRAALDARLGMMLPQMAARRWKDAAATARRVLRAAPRNFLAESRLAWCLYNLGRHDEAERLYSELIQRYPADLDLRSGLGWAQLKQGKHVAATRTFRAILERSPDHGTAKAGLRLLIK
jgi:tetratricopeptide (TPR) repeat protein